MTSRPHLLDALRDHVLLCDGGMGSRVQALTLDIESDYWGRENCTDVLDLSRPDMVREIHRGYFEAGADMVETNTFGGSPDHARRVRPCGSRARNQQASPANWRARRPRASPTGATAGWSAASGRAPNCRAWATSTTTRWRPRWPSNAAG